MMVGLNVLEIAMAWTLISADAGEVFVTPCLVWSEPAAIGPVGMVLVYCPCVDETTCTVILQFEFGKYFR